MAGLRTYSLDDAFFFGKHKGSTVKEVIDSGPEGKGYIQWAVGKPILQLDDEAKEYLRTGKLPEVKRVDPAKLDFWQRLAITGPDKDIPF